jgi:hypothetical protein
MKPITMPETHDIHDVLDFIESGTLTGKQLLIISNIVKTDVEFIQHELLRPCEFEHDTPVAERLCMFFKISKRFPERVYGENINKKVYYECMESIKNVENNIVWQFYVQKWDLMEKMSIPYFHLLDAYIKIFKRKNQTREDRLELLNKEFEVAREHVNTFKALYRGELVESVKRVVNKVFTYDMDWNDQKTFLTEFVKERETNKTLTLDEFADKAREKNRENIYTFDAGNIYKPDEHIQSLLWRARALSCLFEICECAKNNSMTPNILDAYNEVAQEWFEAHINHSQKDIDGFSELIKYLYNQAKTLVEYTDVRRKPSKSSARKKKKKQVEPETDEPESDEEIVLQVGTFT